MSEQITVYSHDFCIACAPVLALLKQAGVDYAYVDVIKDDAGREELQRINRGRNIVPTLTFPDGTIIRGADVPALRRKLGEVGYGTSGLNRVIKRLRGLFKP